MADWKLSITMKKAITYSLITYSLFFLICISGCSNKIVTKTTDDEFTTIQNVIETKLSKWKEFSLKKDAGFDLKSFKLYSAKALNPEQEYHYPKGRTNILDSMYYFCYSPDSTKYVDIYSSHAELDSINGKVEAMFSPDTDAHLVDLIKQKIIVILSLGTDTSLDDIAWIDNNSFVIVGYSYQEPVRQDAPLKCNPYIYYVNLKDKTIKTYMSTLSLDKLPGYYNYKFPEFVKDNNLE